MVVAAAVEGKAEGVFEVGGELDFLLLALSRDRYRDDVEASEDGDSVTFYPGREERRKTLVDNPREHGSRRGQMYRSDSGLTQISRSVRSIGFGM